jgi:hypothetical protein
VVVVRKDCSCFEFPAEVAGDSEKAALQNIETLPGSEMVSFKISASRNEVGSVFGKLVSRRVRPGNDRLSHGIRVGRPLSENNSFSIADL